MEEKQEQETRLVPGVGRLPYPAYRGTEPYIFVSYAHLDHERVFAEIRRFNEAGFHVWYDEGIAPGNEWADAIAEALSRCAVFTVFLTPTSAARENVLNEIDFALNEQKPFLAIYLDETELTPGMKLRISRKQAILRYNMSEEEYSFKYYEAFTGFGLKPDGQPKPAEEPKEEKPASDPLIRPGAAVDWKKLDEFRKKVFHTESDHNGFQIQAGMLNGYNGTEKDLVLPPSVTIVGPFSFRKCRSFLESVDLSNVSIIQPGTFTDCPHLHTVRVSGKAVRSLSGLAFKNCPNLTLYIRRSQIAPGFEQEFTGKSIVFLDE